MDENETSGLSPQEDRARAWAACIAFGLIMLGVLALGVLQTVPARAQEIPVDSVESGPIVSAGMMAGLLIFALVALLHHHRRTAGTSTRIALLEAALEARDDRIWALEERLTRATGLADAQGDLVLREDAHGRITHASAPALEIAGKPLDEIAGRPFPFRVKTDGPRVVHADGSCTFDQEIATRTGSRWISWREVSIRDSAGKIVETQRVGRDITVRVAAEHTLAEGRERAEAASRAKSRFLAVVSHEVRTPLNGILGMADLLLDTPLSPEQQTYARAVKTSGEALLGLIEEILDFSKIEAGRLDLESVPFDLSALVGDVVELMAPRAQEKGIEIACDIDDGVPARVAGDAARLRQVLLNLAGNAVKFTDKGGVAVVVERRGERIRFAVSDTGPGIDEDARARIFQEFEQGDDTLARRHGGTGLGLAIATRIVERMGGEIALSGNEHGGSRFSFSVELPEVGAGARAESVPDFTGTDVLVASPSPVVGPMLARRLSGWNANASLATDPELARTLLRERFWSHFLVDRAFGPEATRLLAATAEPFVRFMHVLVSPAERGELDSLRETGLSSYLVKPVRAASLAARLSHPEAAPSLAPELDDAAGAARPARKALMVLVAEDNEINALLVQALLGKLGHVPTVVSSGVAAVSAVAAAQAMSAPYDLVLMDLHLPGMDGLAATRRIRELGAEGGNLPIIALTANAFSEDRDACRAAGMDAFVVKPLDRARLEAAIAEALQARGSARYEPAA